MSRPCSLCRRQASAQFLGPVRAASSSDSATKTSLHGKLRKARSSGSSTGFPSPQPHAETPRSLARRFPPIRQEYWAATAVTRKVATSDFTPGRRQILEAIITENASPSSDNVQQAIPQELHQMVDELLSMPWEHLSTANAIGVYLDALCRRERLCRKEVRRLQMIKRKIRCMTAADIFEETHRSIHRMSSPLVCSIAEAESNACFERAILVFRNIQDHAIEGADVHHRYMCSFVESLARRGMAHITEEVVRHCQRFGVKLPLQMYALRVEAYANKGDLSGAKKAYDAYYQCLENVRSNSSIETPQLASRRFLLPTGTQIGPPVKTFADLTGHMKALLLRAAFVGEMDFGLIETLFAEMRDQRAPASAAVLIEYLSGWLQRSPVEGYERLLECRRIPHFRGIIQDPYFYRILIRTCADMPSHHPDVILALYRAQLEDSREIGFVHNVSELHILVDAVIAAAVRPDRSAKEALTMLQSAFAVVQDTAVDEAAGRLTSAYTAASNRWFRMSTHGTLRLIGALALYGDHTSAVELYRMVYQHGRPGLIEERRRLLAQSHRIEREELAEPCEARDAMWQETRHPAHAFFWMGLHALGARIEGSSPSLINILDVWEVQLEIAVPMATRWLIAMAQQAARRSGQGVIERLDERQRKLYHHLVGVRNNRQDVPAALMSRAPRSAVV